MISEFFKNPKKENGLQSQCKVCVLSATQRRRELNKENEKEKARARYSKDKQRFISLSLKSYAKHKEKRNAKAKEWREANKENLKKYRSEYSERHKEWVKNNPEKVSLIYNRARAKREGALHPEHNNNIEFTLDSMRLRVQNCLGIKFEKDHILPIACGGPHHHGNLQIIPKSINREKRANLNYTHNLLTHWTKLPLELINWKKFNKLQ